MIDPSAELTRVSSELTALALAITPVDASLTVTCRALISIAFVDIEPSAVVTRVVNEPNAFEFAITPVVALLTVD